MGKPIVIAAANSLPADKARADAVCTGARDELVLSGQIALLTRGGTLLLLDGDYYIDGFLFEDNTAVYFGSGYLKLTGVFAESFFNDRYLHKKPLAPAKGCIGIRSTHGANDGMASIGFDTVYAGGVYTGFRIMGMDHLIMSGCRTCRCCIGHEFAHSCKTLTMINCCDEGNTHLPRFTGWGSLPVSISTSSVSMRLHSGRPVDGR